MAPADAKDPDLESVRAALALAEEAAAETTEFEQRLAADPDDHEARFENWPRPWPLSAAGTKPPTIC